MNKKGQVTIFIIIAVILVISILIIFLIRQQDFQSSQIDSKPVELFIESCIEEEAYKIIEKVAEGGGYYFPPEVSTKTGITYYITNKNNLTPSKEYIENEISFYLEKKLFFCTQNFIDFQDFNITQGEIKAKTRIENETVSLDIKYPLSIKKAENSAFLQDFKVEIPIRLGILHYSAQEFIKKSQNAICLSCLLELSLTYDFYVDMLDHKEDTTIFIFKDEKSKINNKDLRYVFANQYSEDDKD
jgi:hypothetical protein